VGNVPQPVGSHYVEEALYREAGVHNGPTIKPIELHIGIIEHMTPDMARIVGELSADKSRRGVERTLRTTGLVPPSRAFIAKHTTEMGIEIADQRRQPPDRQRSDREHVLADAAARQAARAIVGQARAARRSRDACSRALGSLARSVDALRGHPPHGGSGRSLIRIASALGVAFGPDKYFEAVGVEVANALARRTTESLQRERPRFAQAKLHGGGQPKAEDLAVSHPIDPLACIQSSSEISSTGLTSKVVKLLTSTSSRRIRAMSPSQPARVLRSPPTPFTLLPPVRLMASSTRACVLPLTCTVAPSRASWRAIAKQCRPWSR